jgi:hypothetical protein
VTKPAKEDRRVVPLTKICLALPETTLDSSGQTPKMQARPEIPTSGARSAPQSRPPAPDPCPRRAKRALDVGEVDWEEVSELIACSYRLVAPERLAALVKVEA